MARTLFEIDRRNDVLADAGQQPTVFPAPYGTWSASLCILAHDSGGYRSNIGAALRSFIPELTAPGFVFASVQFA